MSTNNQSWVSGKFIESKGKTFFKSDNQEIEIVSGLEVEAALCGTHFVKGRIGKRDDGFYLLGRMPMFAIPVSFLKDASGRISVSTTDLKKSA